MIRGIVFDCFGVLYGGSLETLLSLCPPGRLTELHDLNKQSDYGFISGEEYIAGLADVLAMTTDGVAAILDQHHIRNSDLVTYLVSLKPNYKIGLLSNVSSGTLDRLFSPVERAQLFDATVLSYEEHLAKPSPEIFRLMADRLGVPVGECVMIDDLEVNCEGADIAGMASVWHITNAQTKEQLNRLLNER